MGQVSGNKIQSIMPSKNIGTKINTQVSGNKIDAKHEYNKITDVQKTQLDGQQKVTNYMGINDEGMDIMKAKKVTGDELNVITNPTIWEGKAKILKAADERIAQHEADVKAKVLKYQLVLHFSQYNYDVKKHKINNSLGNKYTFLVIKYTLIK